MNKTKFLNLNNIYAHVCISFCYFNKHYCILKQVTIAYNYIVFLKQELLVKL